MKKNSKKKDNKEKNKIKRNMLNIADSKEVPNYLNLDPSEALVVKLDKTPHMTIASTNIDQLAFANFSNLETHQLYRDKKFSPSDILFASTVTSMPSPTLNKQIELQDEITKLKKELGKKIEELDEAKEDQEKKEEKINKLEYDQKELLKKENLMHLLVRVNESAQEKLFDSEDFANLFDMNDICKVVIISIDIRRSTDLMLKAKEPKLYAEFITSLCKELTNIIISNFGIFDKFTGDGILAFFPYFYSGPDATFYALKAADECHKAFSKHYEDNRQCFTTVLKEVGLGIGIDFGDGYLTNINNELTVVGNPVVYACRFSGADHGETFLNQPAYEEVKSKYGDHCQFSEADIELKHEGPAVAYKVNSINYDALNIKAPDWDKLVEENKK